MCRYLVAAISVTAVLFVTPCDRTPPPPSISPEPISLSFQMSAPTFNEENQSRACDFYCILSDAHSSCGLDAAKFQRSIQELQEISAGNDFSKLSSPYVKAARLCHDSKIKPTKYVSTSASSRQTETAVDAAPGVEVTTTPVGAVVSVSLPIGWDQKHNTSTETTEIIEYSPHILVSPESLGNLQELEDRAYEATVDTIRKAGFHLFDRSAFVATWAWTWIEAGKIRGNIEFTLRENGTMEAKLFPSGNYLLFKLSDWGDGDWLLEDGHLKITMRRVGKVGVPALTLDHEEKWIDQKVFYVSRDGDEVLLANDERLHRVSGDD